MNRKLALLDLGGVVFQSTGASNAKIDWKVISELNHRYGHGLNIGQDLFPAFMADYNRLTSQQMEGQAFLEKVFDTLTFNAELVNLIRADRDILIVSDNYRENIAYISQRYSFSDWSIGAVYSFDYECVKADEAFFPRLLQEWKTYAVKDMLFIDDSPHKLESAESLGIKGILFRGNRQFREAWVGEAH